MIMLVCVLLWMLLCVSSSVLCGCVSYFVCFVRLFVLLAFCFYSTKLSCSFLVFPLEKKQILNAPCSCHSGVDVGNVWLTTISSDWTCCVFSRFVVFLFFLCACVCFVCLCDVLMFFVVVYLVFGVCAVARVCLFCVLCCVCVFLALLFGVFCMFVCEFALVCRMVVFNASCCCLLCLVLL